LIKLTGGKPKFSQITGR